MIQSSPPAAVFRHCFRRAIFLLAVLMLGLASVSLPAGRAAADTRSAGATATVLAPKVIRQNSTAKMQSWRQMLLAQHTSPAGCYKAHYPDTGWTAVPCVKARPMATPPRLVKFTKGTAGRHPAITGNFNDIMALSNVGTTQASGAVAEIDNLTSESDSKLGAGSYSLQMNTNGFTPPASVCSGCAGVVQFVYNQSAAQIYAQYWMLGYITNTVTSCPGGWNTSGTACFKNGVACNDTSGMSATSVPAEVTADIPQVVLYGQAVAGGNDTVALAAGNYMYKQSACDNILNLSGSLNWTATEFNVFGTQNSSNLTFNTGVLMTVTISLTDTSADFPSCTTVSKSGGGVSTLETTNMNLGACKPTRTGVSFVEGVPPQTATISPTIGAADGGTKVVITGTTSNGQATGGFSTNMQALFGTPFGGIFVGAVCAANQCTAYAPAGTGSVYVMVENLTSVGAPGVLSNPNLNFAYAAYPQGILSPSSGPNAGQTTVGLSGHNFNLSPGGTIITFGFASGPQNAANVACGPSSSSVPAYSQICSFATPPLPDPPGYGSTLVPVTATVGSYTSPVGGFTYTPPVSPPPTCAMCLAQGERCIFSHGAPVCVCQKSSPKGECE